MYTTCLVIQWITLFIVIAEAVSIFTRMNNKAHYFLFINCVGMVISSIGCLMSFYANSGDAYYQNILLSWGGKIVIVVSTFLFIENLSKYRMPKIVPISGGVFGVVTFVIMLTTEQTKLFYIEKSFATDNGIIRFNYVKGIWYYLWDAFVLATVLLCIYMLVRSLRNEQDVQKKKQYRLFIYALVVEAAMGFVLMLPITWYYDLNQVGFILCALLSMVAIFRSDLMDTVIMAREYVIDELSAGVIAEDTSGDIVYYNKLAAKIMPVLRYNRVEALSNVKNIIREGGNVTIGDRIYTIEDRPFFEKSGNERHIYAIIDSTAQFRHIEEIREQKEMADKANKEKADFLLGMSNELKTLINAVISKSELILKESSEDSVKEKATGINYVGKTLNSVVNDIIDYSKLDFEKMEVNPIEYSPRSFFLDILDVIKSRTKDRKLILETNISPDIPKTLYGDGAKIKQILSNLLANSFKHSANGIVMLRTNVYKRINEDDEKFAILHFEVEECTTGLNDNISKLFTLSEGEKIADSNKPEEGLGVSIADKILTMMDSRLLLKKSDRGVLVYSFNIKQKIVDESAMGDINMNV
ncbi:MAG: hypothetical protein IJM91_02420 [Lachnospiraceae bacterium]|nr:hypothetical protein [Lachnospiraceae bacterium]